MKPVRIECCCSTERIEAIAVQCTFVMPIPREKNLQSFIVFPNVFEKFFIHETMLSAIFYKSASCRSRRFPMPRISTVFRRAQKNTSKIYRKSTENRMTKRIGFYKNDLKSAKSTVSIEGYQKNGILSLATLPFSEDAQNNTP